MKRGIYLAMFGVVMLGVAIVTIGGAQVYPVRWDEHQGEPQPAAPTPPSLVLADGGLQFPDGSVQAAAAPDSPQVILIGAAMIPVTGQTSSQAARDDGDLERGVVWPNPRFTDNGDGTVTDNLTGLIWLADADCLGTEFWADALATANALFDGCSDCGGTNNDCGLADGSIAGQWRLPNVRELRSLVHYGVVGIPIPDMAGTGQWTEGDPFSGVQSALYWSSTTYAPSTDLTWAVGMHNGSVGPNPKDLVGRGWPVRGGQ